MRSDGMNINSPLPYLCSQVTWISDENYMKGCCSIYKNTRNSEGKSYGPIGSNGGIFPIIAGIGLFKSAFYCARYWNFKPEYSDTKIGAEMGFNTVLKSFYFPENYRNCWEYLMFSVHFRLKDISKENFLMMSKFWWINFISDLMLTEFYSCILITKLILETTDSKWFLQ